MLSLVAAPAISSLRVNAPKHPSPLLPPPTMAMASKLRPSSKTSSNLPTSLISSRGPVAVFHFVLRNQRQDNIPLYCTVLYQSTVLYIATDICTQLGTSTQARLQHGQTPPRCSNQAWIGQRTQRAQRAQRFRRYRPSPHMNDSMPATS